MRFLGIVGVGCLSLAGAAAVGQKPASCEAGAWCAGVLSVVTARSLSRRLIRYREALSRLDRGHLLVQAVMKDHDGVTNTVALALRQIEGVSRVAAVYIDELFEE